MARLPSLRSTATCRIWSSSEASVSLVLLEMESVMPDDPDIADELAYMAEHPTLFTKAEMAAMMKAAAARLRANREALAKVRGGNHGGDQPS